METKKAIERQQHIIKMQMNCEDYFASMGDLLAKERPVVLLCDRGMCDGKAYVDDELWQAILSKLYWLML